MKELMKKHYLLSIILIEVVVFLFFTELASFCNIQLISKDALEATRYSLWIVSYFLSAIFVVYLLLPKGTVKKYYDKVFIFMLLLIYMTSISSIPLILFYNSLSKSHIIVRIIYQLSCDLLIMFAIYKTYEETIKNNFKEYFKNFKENLEESFKYYIIGLAIMMISNIIINLFFKGAIAGNEEKVREYINLYPLYMIFSASLYAPFVEELLFRKSIKDIVLADKKNKITKYIYILTSGLVFGGMHVMGNVTETVDLLYLIPYSALGIAFAANYHKTNNIFSTITIHCLHNTVAMILYLSIGGI